MQSQNFDCQICCSSFNQGERVPKICPCGHTLCLYCLNQHLAFQPKCPFCRFDMDCFRHDPDLVTTNRALKELVEDKCLFHSELRTLICLTCKNEICSACVYLDNSHPAHKIIHRNRLLQQKKETKEQLWATLDKQRKFKNALLLLLHHSEKIAMNKLMKLEGIADKRMKESILQETHLFFSMEEERVSDALEEDDEGIQAIQEQIAQLDNPRVDEEVLEALGKDPIELRAEKQHKLLLNDMINFNQVLDQTIEFTLLLDSIQQTYHSVADSSVVADENQRTLFNIRKLLNFDFRCDALVVSQEILNRETACENNCDCLSPRVKDSNHSDKMFISFEGRQEPREVANITIRILDLLRKKSHALVDLLSNPIDQKTPLSLWSLKFWLQGVMVFEINLYASSISNEEMGSLFGKVLPQLTTLQELNLDFKEANIEDADLMKFEDKTLKDLKKLQVLKFDFNGTRATSQGVAWIFERLMEMGQDFSVNLGFNKIYSKDLHRFIQTALFDDKDLKTLVTSFEIKILQEHLKDNLTIGKLFSQTEAPSSVSYLFSEYNDLSVGTEFMRISEYVKPSEESGYKLLVLKLSSHQDKSTNNTSTNFSEVQSESTPLERENS